MKPSYWSHLCSSIKTVTSVWRRPACVVMVTAWTLQEDTSVCATPASQPRWTAGCVWVRPLHIISTAWGQCSEDPWMKAVIKSLNQTLSSSGLLYFTRAVYCKGVYSQCFYLLQMLMSVQVSRVGMAHVKTPLALLTVSVIQDLSSPVITTVQVMMLLP